MHSGVILKTGTVISKILNWIRARFVRRIMRDVVKIEQDFVYLGIFFSARSIFVQLLYSAYCLYCHFVSEHILYFKPSREKEREKKRECSHFSCA